MEIRLNGKTEGTGPGYKAFSTWITKPNNREILVINLGECKITIHPFDREQIRQLGEKLILLSST